MTSQVPARGAVLSVRARKKWAPCCLLASCTNARASFCTPNVQPPASRPLCTTQHGGPARSTQKMGHRLEGLTWKSKVLKCQLLRFLDSKKRCHHHQVLPCQFLHQCRTARHHQGKSSRPVICRSIHESTQQPLFTRRRVDENCPRHGRPSLQQSDLYFVFPPVLEAFADICFPFRQVDTCGAYCIVRVTAGCGRPQAVTERRLAPASLAFLFGCEMFFGQRPPAPPPRCSMGGRHTHIKGSTASWDSTGGENISRPGCCFCGALAVPSLRPGMRATGLQGARERMHGVLSWLPRCCRLLRVPAESRNVPQSGQPPSPV